MRKLLSMTAAVLVLSGALWAQTIGVSQISGTVKDQSGAVLPGVEIKVTQTDTGLSKGVITDERGTYQIGSLPVGPYKLEAGLPGFLTYVQNGIIIQVNS